MPFFELVTFLPAAASPGSEYTIAANSFKLQAVAPLARMTLLDFFLYGF